MQPRVSDWGSYVPAGSDAVVTGAVASTFSAIRRPWNVK